MKNFFLLPLAVLSLVTFNSCKNGDDEPEAENKKPTVTITNPTGTIYVSNSTDNPITFSATASDEDGTISKVQFYFNGGAAGAPLTSEPYSVALSIDAGNNQTFKVIATDNEGAKTEKSITVNVVVAP